MKILRGSQGATCNRTMMSESGNPSAKNVAFLIDHSLPVLKGLEEQEEEELFPVLPVFLLR